MPDTTTLEQKLFTGVQQTFVGPEAADALGHAVRLAEKYGVGPDDQEGVARCVCEAVELTCKEMYGEHGEGA